MKKINGHSVSDKLVLYMIKELGGIEAVVAAHKATLPAEPPDPIADTVLNLFVSNTGITYSVDEIIELFPELNQQSAYNACQKLIRAGKIKYACASYQRRMYWIPDPDTYPISCRDCYYYEYADRHPSFKDASVKIPSGCCANGSGYISVAAQKSNHCYCFVRLEEADLKRQEDAVFGVMEKMEQTPYGVERDENDEVITKEPRRMPWDSNALSSEIAGYDTEQMDRVLARLHAKGRIREDEIFEAWHVVNKE